MNTPPTIGVELWASKPIESTAFAAPGTFTLDLPNGRRIAIEDWVDDKLYETIKIS